MKLFQRVMILVFIAVLAVVPVAAQEVTECEAGFRLFDHELLATDPVCIPDSPQRVVALENAAVELLLFTDIELAGAFGVFTTHELAASLPAIADDFEGIVEFEWPVNLELLLETAPDLIVAYRNDTMVYEQLSAIAPTVIFDADLGDGNWKVATEFWSEVYGVEEVYAEMLATYDARIAELQEALGEDRGDIEVSVFLISTWYNIIYGSTSPIGEILADAGLGRPDSQNLDIESTAAIYDGATYAYISEETLDLTTGDVVFLFTFPSIGEEAVAASDQFIEEFVSNPLWQSLPAVSAGNVHHVGYHWARGNTFLLANAIIDDLFTYLTDVEPTVENPIVQFEDAE